MDKQGLLLTRKVGESIVVLVNGQKILVSVESIGAKSTRIRVHAPNEHKIWRKEIAPATSV